MFTILAPRLRRYGIALLALLASTLMRLLLDPILGDYAPYSTFLAATVVVAWFGGIGPALFTLAGGVLIADFLFMPPQGFPLPQRVPQWLAFGIFLSVGIFVLALIESLRRARTRAETSESNFRRLLEAGNVGIGLADAYGGVYYANTALLKLLGYTAEEVAAGQLRWDRITAPEFSHVTSEVIRHVSETCGEALPYPPYEKVYIAKDGRRIPVLIALVPFDKRPDGTGVGAAFVMDLSRVKDAEAALRVSEERLRLAAQAAMFGTYDVDLITGKRFWSPELKAIMGLPAEVEAPEDVPDQLHPDDRERFRRDLELSRDPSGSGERQGEYRVVRPGGEVRWISVTGKTIFSGPQEARFAIRAVGTVVDITARKQNEEQLIALNQTLTDRESSLRHANAELQQFASIASHDLKAPLRAVHQLSTLIEEEASGLLSEEGRRNLVLLRERVGRMDALINALLDYSRAGGKVERLEQVDTAQLVREIVHSQGPPEGIEIRIAPDLPQVETDRLHLQQVFANLIENAVQHHGSAEGVVRVSARDEEDFYRFTIADDGLGIPPEYQERIFEMFQRGPESQSSGGTGIGLAVVKKVVEGFGGEVRLESAPGHGSSFHFTWPKSVRLPHVEPPSSGSCDGRSSTPRQRAK